MSRSHITKAINFVESKLDGTEQNSQSANVKLFGTVHQSRQDLNKRQSNLVDCMIDCHGNWYNPDRVMDGKVKRFVGNTPKERLIVFLQDLYED